LESDWLGDKEGPKPVRGIWKERNQVMIRLEGSRTRSLYVGLLWVACLGVLLVVGPLNCLVDLLALSQMLSSLHFFSPLCADGFKSNLFDLGDDEEGPVPVSGS
jgi:hypothetical protein